MPPESIVAALQRWAATAPERPAYHLLGEDNQIVASLSYAELDRRARTIAAHLARARLSPDARVVVMYPEGLEFVTAFMGCLYAGVIAVPAPFAGTLRSVQDERRLQAIATDAQAALLLTNQVGDQALDLPLSRLVTDTLPAANDERWDPVLDRAGVAYLQYTSGSTGTPKGIGITQANLAHSLAAQHQVWGYTPDSVALVWMPHVHDYGLVEGLLRPLSGGIPCFIMPTWTFVRRPLRWLQAIGRYGVTHSGGATFAYAWCVRQISPDQRRDLNLSSWQVAIIGAEPIQPALVERFAAAFAPCGFRDSAFCPGYGLAETTLLATAKRRDTPLVLREVSIGPRQTRLTSCGRPLDSGQVIIVDPVSGRPCAPGEVGEVWFAGPTMAAGYWQQPDATRETFQARLAEGDAGPFLRSGDLGLLDQGDLFITGRLKDMIIIRGQNLYPQDIEWALAGCHPATEGQLAAVFGIPLADGEQLGIVQEIDPRRWTEPNWQAVIAALRQRVAEQFELPVQAVVLLRRGDLPKTSSGKIQRTACRAAYESGAWHPLAIWQRPALEDAANHDRAGTDLVARLTAIWQDCLQTSVGPDDNFFALGGDSLTALHLALAVEERLHQPIDPAFFQNPTVANMARLLAPANSPPLDQLVVAHGSRPAVRPRPADRNGLMHRGPLVHGRALPYSLGVRLQRAWLTQSAVQNKVFAEEIAMLRQWGERLGAPPDADMILQNLLTNTWRDWRKRALARPLGASPWLTVRGDPAAWQARPAGPGIIFLVLHSPLSALFRRSLGLSLGSGLPLFIRGQTGETPQRNQDRAAQVYQAYQALLRGEAVVIAGDGGKGQQGIQIPFFGSERLFRQGGADLAVQTGARLIPVFAIMTATGRIEIEVCPPLAGGSGSPQRQVEQLTRAYAELVRERWPQVYASLSWDNLARWLTNGRRRGEPVG